MLLSHTCTLTPVVCVESSATTHLFCCQSGRSPSKKVHQIMRSSPPIIAALVALFASGHVGAWQPAAQTPPVRHALSASPLRAVDHARRGAALCMADEDGNEPTAATADAAPEKVWCDFPGCDQNGRAIGGLAAIPLFEWWPIKAYRPCPKCAERGVKYSRSGQSLDEIVFKKNPKGGYYGDD